MVSATVLGPETIKIGKTYLGKAPQFDEFSG